MNERVLYSTLSDVQLEPDKIPQQWLISGCQETRSKVLGRTHDRLAYVVLWECGATSYRWHYGQDEAYIVLSGEGFMTDEKGVEHRFGPGDVAFFPAGTTAIWRHPDHFKKVAVLKRAMWRPLAFGMAAWSRFLHVLGKLGFASS